MLADLFLFSSGKALDTYIAYCQFFLVCESRKYTSKGILKLFQSPHCHEENIQMCWEAPTQKGTPLWVNITGPEGGAVYACNKRG